MRSSNRVSSTGLVGSVSPSRFPRREMSAEGILRRKVSALRGITRVITRVIENIGLERRTRGKRWRCEVRYERDKSHLDSFLLLFLPFFSLVFGEGRERNSDDYVDSSTAPVLVNNFLRFRRCGNELLRKFQVAHL